MKKTILLLLISLIVGFSGNAKEITYKGISLKGKTVREVLKECQKVDNTTFAGYPSINTVNSIPEGNIDGKAVYVLITLQKESNRIQDLNKCYLDLVNSIKHKYGVHKRYYNNTKCTYPSRVVTIVKYHYWRDRLTNTWIRTQIIHYNKKYYVQVEIHDNNQDAESPFNINADDI